MALGIDPGSILRVVGENREKTLFGAQGVPPCRNHESHFIWSDKRVCRQTEQVKSVQFEQAWAEVMKPDDSTFSWSLSGQEMRKSWDLVVAEALHQLIPHSKGKIAIAVDNSLNEKKQDALLSLCSRAHLLSIDLLWRPVAIALDFLSKNQQGRLAQGGKVLVVDAESMTPEITLLELRSRSRTLIPLRAPFREEQDPVVSDWRSFDASKDLARLLSNNDSNVEEGLANGIFSADFQRYRDGEDVPHTWVKDGPRYRAHYFSRSLDELCAGMVDALVAEAKQRAAEAEADIILWHGWPFRFRADLNAANSILMPANSVARGAKIYAECVENNKPTYLENIPLTEIISKDRHTGHVEFFPIVEEGEYEGGRARSIAPINQFSIQQGLQSLPIILRRSDWEMARKVEFDNLPVFEEEVPVTITGELKPGQGRLKLWIEPREGPSELFGEQRRIEINWEGMIEIEDPSRRKNKAPQVYPITGRVFDQDDADIRQALREMVRVGGRLTTEVMYNNRNVRFNKVFDPWGYNDPFGKRLNEPTRGMFGPAHIEDEEVIRLAEDLAKNIENYHGTNQGKRHEYLNKMFVYTSSEFMHELRGIYSKEKPAIDSWNTAFAPGRVFSTSEDMTIFLNFIVSSCNDSGWPDWPDISYTTKYFWSVFRCLCYYEETADIDCGLAEKVCHRVCNYIAHRNNNNWHAVQGEAGGRWTASNVKNSQKFCLCALLYMTRIRNACPRFLEYPCKNGSLTQEVIDAIEQMPAVPFPKTMNFGGGDGDNLSRFTLRFIKNEATEDDFDGLEGLITSMA